MVWCGVVWCDAVVVVVVQTVLRVWDCMFLEGIKVMFRACLSLLYVPIPNPQSLPHTLPLFPRPPLPHTVLLIIVL